MELNNKEKDYLRQVLKREIDNFKKHKKVFLGEGGIVFFQAEEEYEKFLKELLKKLK